MMKHPLELPPPPLDRRVWLYPPLWDSRKARALRAAEHRERALREFINWHLGAEGVAAADRFIAAQGRKDIDP